MAALAVLDPRVRPLALASERSLPVLPALHDLLPDGLPRGSTVAITGPAGRSFALGLLAAATLAGSWLAVVGVPGLGWRAAGELGLDLTRVVVVDPVPGSVVPDTLAALVDGFDAVLAGVGVRAAPPIARRLAARARERGTVVVWLGEPWADGTWAPGRPVRHGNRDVVGGVAEGIADLRANVEGRGWEGLGSGTGRLQGRRVEVQFEGRRLPGRRRSGRLWLPDPGGEVALANVASFPRAAAMGAPR